MILCLLRVLFSQYSGWSMVLEVYYDEDTPISSPLLQGALVQGAVEHTEPFKFYLAMHHKIGC